MDAGQLDRRLTPQTLTTADDGHGGQTETWTDGAPLWADMRELGGREALSANAVASRATYLVTTRYRTDLTTRMRLVWAARSLTMEIVAVRDRPEGRNQWLELECVEVHL